MMPVFVDTSGLYVLMDTDDPRHAVAQEFVTARSRPLVTSEYVFDEIVTNTRRDFGYRVARNFGERLRASEFCSIVPIEPEDVASAWEIFCRYEDQDFRLHRLHQASR